MTPDQMIEKLNDGYTMAEIGGMCGKSRSAVSGAIYRYRKANDIELLIGKEKFQPVKYAAVDVSNFGAVLERNGCRYIAGDIKLGTATYCSGGNDRKGYCERHFKICHKKMRRVKK